MKRREIILELEELTKNNNFLNIISRFILRDFCGTLDELYTTRDPWEHFNYNEAAFIIGLWLKNSTKEMNNITNYNSTLGEIYKMMENIHRSFIHEGPNLNEKGKSAKEMMMVGSLFQEAFFYGSVGAYDFQYINIAKEKYKYDNQWLLDNKGFSINSFSPFFENIKKLLTIKINKLKELKEKNEQTLIEIFSLTKEDIVKENIEFENILLNFSIEANKNSNGQLLNIGDYNEFYTKPIIKLDSNNYYIPLAFSIAEAIFESPFYWMNQDKNYSNISSKNRGIIGEELTYKLLKRVVDSKNIFQSVKINKSNSITITDIDIIIFHKQTAIVFQVKSKKLTSLSKQGNLESIKTDHKKAVENAFLQGLTSKECIESPNNYNFIDVNGLNINDKINNVKNTYIICIVLDTFPAISHTIDVMLYNNYEESTICFSILDLEVICNYLNTPEILLDYLVKRITNCRYYYAENELCFLGFYLEHGLNPLNEYNAAYIPNDYGSKIDRNYYPSLSRSISYSNLKKESTPKKVGRNERCPCGSGKKNKNCHRYDFF